MAKLTRRQFGKLAGLGSLGLMTGCTTSSLIFRKKPRVAVVGGGFGGATAAKYLRMSKKA